MRKVFKSISTDQRAYALESGLHSERRGDYPLLGNLLVFDVLGDGLCQHSPASVVQMHDAVDACYSLAAAILAEPGNKDWQCLTSIYYNHALKDAAIRFALSVVHRESTPERGFKPQYYSPSELKVTTADKRNDRRYERVEGWMNGTAESAVGILLREHDYDWLVRFLVALRAKEIYEDEMGGGYVGMARIFKPLADLGDEAENAVRALRSAFVAVEQLERVERLVECKRERIERDAEKAHHEKQASESGVAA